LFGELTGHNRHGMPWAGTGVDVAKQLLGVVAVFWVDLHGVPGVAAEAQLAIVKRVRWAKPILLNIGPDSPH
jgi:hypothetical protein